MSHPLTHDLLGLYHYEVVNGRFLTFLSTLETLAPFLLAWHLPFGSRSLRELGQIPLSSSGACDEVGPVGKREPATVTVVFSGA
jgi:hypothetical protein